MRGPPFLNTGCTILAFRCTSERRVATPKRASFGISRHRMRRGVKRDIYQWSASVAGVVITGEEPAKSAAATVAERHRAILVSFGANRSSFAIRRSAH